MNNETNQLLEIKEVKIVRIEMYQSSQDKINKYLENGWVILVVQKSVDEYNNEFIYYHLGRL